MAPIVQKLIRQLKLFRLGIEPEDEKMLRVFRYCTDFFTPVHKKHIKTEMGEPECLFDAQGNHIASIYLNDDKSSYAQIPLRFKNGLRSITLDDEIARLMMTDEIFIVLLKISDEFPEKKFQKDMLSDDFKMFIKIEKDFGLKKFQTT